MTEKDLDKRRTSASIKIPRVQISGNVKVVAEYEGESTALCCAVLSKKEEIAIGRSKGIIEILSSENLSKLKDFKSSEGLPVTSLSVYKPKDENQMLLSSFVSGETIMWNTETNEEVWKVVEDRQSFVNGFSCDYSKFAVGGSDAKITVYDADDRNITKVLQGSLDPKIMDGHTMRIFCLRFHPSRRYELISGGWDDTIQFWDIREPFSSRKIRGPHICGDGIDFLDENKFITASWRKKDPLQVWDYRTGKLIENIKADDWKCFLYCCQHDETGSVLLASGSHKNMMRVIDINTLKSFATIRDLPGAIYFAKELPKRDLPSNKMNVCFCSDKSIYLASVELI